MKITEPKFFSATETNYVNLIHPFFMILSAHVELISFNRILQTYEYQLSVKRNDLESDSVITTGMKVPNIYGNLNDFRKQVRTIMCTALERRERARA